jgi:hypothetical protein
MNMDILKETRENCSKKKKTSLMLPSSTEYEIVN